MGKIRWGSALVIGMGTGLAIVGVITIPPLAFVGLGAAGTCTAWGYAIGAIGGLISGAVAATPDASSDLTDTVKNYEFREENLIQILCQMNQRRANLEKKRANLEKKVVEWDLYQRNMINWTRVAVGAACADGDINDGEREIIESLLFRGSFVALPNEFHRAINATLAEKITLEDARCAYLEISLLEIRSLCREMIEIVMLCDADSGLLHPQEVSYLIEWDRLDTDGPSIVA